MKPVCVRCHRFFKMVKSGFYLIEGKPTELPAEPGVVAPDKWEPYKLWAGDLWRCPGCGAEILSGFGFHSVAEHFEPDFKEQLEKFGATFQVNDC